MPWKGEKDPYRIWLSEIILQQTRVDQGLNYYKDFVRTFRTIHQLAAAPEAQVFKLWEGLGYYTRCRNLIATAKYISAERKGVFPDTYDSIKALKGIGPYTAAAIASFAYDLPHAVVDGNVFRVLSRIFGISIPVDTTTGKKYFTQLAEELLDKKRPGLYNQAIMDFGAVICKPQPLCDVCVFQKYCYAYRNNKITELPVKEKKIRIRTRWFYYLVLEYRNTFAIRQRSGKDIWQQLFEFPLLERTGETGVEKILKEAQQKKWIIKNKYQLLSFSSTFKQKLSHQLINGRFTRIRLTRKPDQSWIWVNKEELNGHAFPQFINQYLRTK